MGSESWEARMAERSAARAASAAEAGRGIVDAWASFCHERGGLACGVDGLYHAYFAAHSNVTFSAIDGSMGGVFSVALTGDEPQPIEECPICRDVARGLWWHLVAGQ